MRKGKTYIQSALAVTCAALFVAACGGGGDSAATGTLRTAMTDAPSCGYDNVFVTVDEFGSTAAPRPAPTVAVGQRLCWTSHARLIYLICKTA